MLLREEFFNKKSLQLWLKLKVSPLLFLVSHVTRVTCHMSLMSHVILVSCHSCLVSFLSDISDCLWELLFDETQNGRNAPENNLSRIGCHSSLYCSIDDSFDSSLC